MKKKTSRLDEILREKFLKGEFDSIERFKPTIVGINVVRVKIFLESWCSTCFADKEIKEVKGDTHCLESLAIENLRMFLKKTDILDSFTSIQMNVEKIMD